ncbi:MAG TPA: COR domain-containing protein [Actinocrinis sp.]|nr:COR domain-containing protein [Actinocrinis sp.]
MSRGEQIAQHRIQRAKAGLGTRLDLGGLGLDEIPADVRTLRGMRRLDLTGNELRALPDWLPELDRLERLALDDNRLTALPDWLGGFAGLRRLSFADNWLTELPRALAALKGLTLLDVGGNDLPAVPDWIAELTGLRHLYLADCQLTEVPEWVPRLHALTRLNLGDNDLASLPDRLAASSRLRQLDISDNRFERFPEVLRQLPEVRALWASGNRLDRLPEWIGELTRLRVLQLDGNQLTELPGSLARLKNLVHLAVGANAVTDPPRWIGELDQLVRLSLQRCGLSRVPEWIKDLPRLAELRLQNNHLTELPEWIGDRSTLRVLHLGDNPLGVLPRSLSRLTRLTTLGLSSTRLVEIPAWVGELRRLRIVNLGYNKFDRLPDCLAKLTRLEQLSAYGCQLTELPEWLGRLGRLTFLDVSQNELAKLPESLARLDRLTSLLVHDNPLATAPDWIVELPSLAELQIGTPAAGLLPRICGMKKLRALAILDESVSELPDAIGDLDRLELFFVGSAALHTIPDSVGRLTRLAHLRVAGSRLTALPSWVGDLKRLRSLQLTNNEFTSVPEGLGGLKRLRWLSISKNPLGRIPAAIRGLDGLRNLIMYDVGLTEVPDWIGELTGLTRLDLDRNQFAELPASVARLVHLQELNVSHNWLVEVPPALRAMRGMEKLWLNDNAIRALPAWLVELPRLAQLTVQNNPLVSPPPEIASSGPTSALEFLRARQQGSVRQWQSKMLVVGEGAVGKTTTIKRLLGEPYDAAEGTTHGLRVYDHRVGHPADPDVAMTLNTWDFGGQEIYHATHQFFLTDRSLFLLLWNSRMQWIQGRLRYWLDIIAARAPESPILLVATNAPAEGRPADLPLDDLKRDYPQIVANIAIDNETGHGLDALRAAVATQAACLPLMGTEWPLTWLNAANAIRALPEKHVPPGRLWKEMSAAGLRDARHQRYVARALHQLGDILYYEDDPELAETVILRPEWVNEYISRVLDSPEVERCHGLLRRDHLGELWADLDRGMREHFLGMMDRYDLSYKVDGGSGNDLSLVVERLPWNAPAYQAKWDRAASATAASTGGPEHEIRVVYQLNTTPPGIPTWFIARSHRFSTGVHWRTGALLAHPDGQHRALVRTDIHRNTIGLTVRGKAPARLFAVLDDGLNFTLARYPGLSIKRMVPCPCGEGSDRACDELYDFDDLERRLARTPPRHTIECRKSGADVHVPLLLLGLAPSDRDEWRARLERLEDAVSAQHGDLVSRLDDLSGDLQRQFLKVQQQLQSGLETRCPSVFVVTPIRQSKLRGATYELTLYCEEPGAWHPLPSATGTYALTESPLWLRKVAPYLRELVGVLKHAAPLVGPVLGVSVDKLNEHVKADVEAMKALVDQIPSIPVISSAVEEKLAGAGGVGAGGDPVGRAATDADFRALEALFAKLDPDRGWGGLSRVATPEGLTVYLCPEHAAPYSRIPRSLSL